MAIADKILNRLTLCKPEKKFMDDVVDLSGLSKKSANIFSDRLDCG